MKLHGNVHVANLQADTAMSGGGQEYREPQMSIESRLQVNNEPSVDNFDGDKVEKWRLTALACGGGCRDFSAMEGKPIDLKYYYCHLIEMVNKQSGETVTPIRSVLIDKGLNAYGFVSDYIPRELDTIIKLFGQGPYTEPMSILVLQVNTRKGNRIYTISPA